MPNPVSLGIHALVDMAGRMKFGPDAEYLPDRRLDYRVDEAKLAAFGRSVRKLVPAISDDDLAPDMSGIRPKLQARGRAREGLRHPRGSRPRAFPASSTSSASTRRA